jgi:hypothetical protein
MDSKKPVIIKRSTQPPAEPQRRSQLVQESVIETPVKQPDIEQPEQPEPELYLESLAESPIDQSVYGSGWSVAELMDEFSGRL